ncbi:glycosyltransferase family 4 protein [Aureimonas sp. AU12]|uniref:glycosyltransferase family 4 protein n=1 Tax=Aureimonas sp. AU12 TaxID=1638161 RepID=UPI0009E9C5AE|nr:glycosyltransferase family 4 protein [Aureimonas sp. AU12]
MVVKGYPRLSETFIAQEILGLEEAGLPIQIWSLRKPTDGAVHELHRRIRAEVHYLPEYLYQGPVRVLRGLTAALRRPGFRAFAAQAWCDLKRDPSASRARRIGQSLVLAHELDPTIRHLHAHFLHTPASVTRYAALLRGDAFTFSAHAKDIWTTPDWEKREKIAASRWGVTCTRTGLAELRRLSPAEPVPRVELVYHGLDLARFPPSPAPAARRDGGAASDPVRFVSVGRLVAKKGFDDLLDALARLPPDLHWRWTHVGGGELKAALKAQAERLGLGARIDWRGALPQAEVIAALREADLFVLPCKEGDGGDRDGLPNVLMEAATQALAILSTRYAGVPEFVEDGREGLLVPPGDAPALSAALERLARDPDLRQTLGRAAERRVREDFSFEAGLRHLAARFEGTRTGEPAGPELVRFDPVRP